MRDNEPTRRVLLVAVAAVTLTACGGSKTAPAPTTPTPQPPVQKDYSNYYPPGTHKAPAGAVRVITRWSTELRAGHVRRAAAYMDPGVLVQNGTAPMRLASRRAIFEWNRDLPCGAHVVKTLAGKQYVVATFVLTQRPDTQNCGSTGKLAATAFLIRNGKITEWRRVLVPPPLGPAENLKQDGPAS